MRRPMTQDKLDALFTAVGAGVWYVQLVEDGLCHTIVLIRDIQKIPGVTLDQATAIIRTHRKSTFGFALRKAREAAVVPAPLLDRLTSLKHERDWLVHRALADNGDDLYDDALFVRFIERIAAMVEEAKHLQKELSDHLQQFVVSKGVDPKRLEATALRAHKKATGESA